MSVVTDTRDEQPSLNVRVARIAGWREWTEADRGPECTLDDGGRFCYWIDANGDHWHEVPDYEHDPAFFVRLMVANGLLIGPTIASGWQADNAQLCAEAGYGPDPIHAALDWAERAKAEGVPVRWEV